MLANRSFRSPKMSEWVNRSFFERIAHSLIVGQKTSDLLGYQMSEFPALPTSSYLEIRTTLHSPPLPILYLHVSATIQLWKDFWVAQWFNQILSNCLTNTVHAVRGFHGKNLKLKQKKKMKKYFFKGFVSKLINTLFGRSVHLFMNFFPALVLKTIVAQMLF